ncbi:uncharacterized protein METZ01_LOCUS499699, partial [marine metagenome]
FSMAKLVNTICFVKLLGDSFLKTIKCAWSGGP